jgi:hypothetical protein
LEQVANDGKMRKMNPYNLDVIIPVGYRVNSQKATRFRIWATKRLKDYPVDGYAINQKRLEERNLEPLFCGRQQVYYGGLIHIFFERTCMLHTPSG